MMANNARWSRRRETSLPRRGSARDVVYLSHQVADLRAVALADMDLDGDLDAIVATWAIPERSHT